MIDTPDPPDSAVRSTTSTADMRRALAMIRQDCVTDSQALDRTPFTQRGVGEALGNVLAQVHALAGVMDAIVGLEHVVVPPGHTLVVSLPDETAVTTLYALTDVLAARLGPDRFVIVGGVAATFATVAPDPLHGDDRSGPHSRACGARPHEHGLACHGNCPTCHGRVTP